MIVFESQRMHPRQQVISLVALLAVVPLMAKHAGSRVICAGVIPVLDFPGREHMVRRQLAARVLMAEDAGLFGLDSVVAAHTGLHRRQMLAGRGVGFRDPFMAARTGYLFLEMSFMTELGTVTHNRLDGSGIIGIAVAQTAGFEVVAFQADIFFRQQIVAAGSAFLDGLVA
jgi:hypothetical protein